MEQGGTGSDPAVDRIDTLPRLRRQKLRRCMDPIRPSIGSTLSPSARMAGDPGPRCARAARETRGRIGLAPGCIGSRPSRGEDGSRRSIGGAHNLTAPALFPRRRARPISMRRFRDACDRGLRSRQIRTTSAGREARGGRVWRHQPAPRDVPVGSRSHEWRGRASGRQRIQRQWAGQPREGRP